MKERVLFSGGLSFSKTDSQLGRTVNERIFAYCERILAHCEGIIISFQVVTQVGWGGMRIRNCRMIMLVAVLVVMLSASGGVAGDGAEPVVDNFIGSVKTVSGEGYLLRDGEKTLAVVGDHFYQGDTLLTASSSSMGVIFRDDTMLSLGASSEVVIDEFVFNPAEGDMSFVASMNKGVGQFITGQMAKIAPERMMVETPLSTIGIRGTRFLVKVD